MDAACCGLCFALFFCYWDSKNGLKVAFCSNSCFCFISFSCKAFLIFSYLRFSYSCCFLMNWSKLCYCLYWDCWDGDVFCCCRLNLCYSLLMRDMSTEGIDMLKFAYVSSPSSVASIVVIIRFLCLTALISISIIGIAVEDAFDYVDYFSSICVSDLDFQWFIYYSLDGFWFAGSAGYFTSSSEQLRMRSAEWVLSNSWPDE